MAQIKVNLDSLSKDILIKETRKELKKTLCKDLKKIIINDHILKGKSPVNGQRRFEKYSDSYRDAIRAKVYSKKRVRPVNLKLTGKMLKTWFCNKITNGVEFGFSSKIAEYHNEGTDKMPKRQLLPTGKKEVFNRSIQISLREMVKTALEKAIKTMTRRS